MSIRLISIIAVAASLAGAGAANAQPTASSADEVVIETPYLPPGAVLHREAVRYADLDLSGPAGASTLLHRINAAAQRVCSPQPATHSDFNDTSDYDRCMAGAMARAVRDVDEPTVTALFEGAGPQYASGYGSGD